MVEPQDYAEFLSEAAASENSVLHEFRILYFGDDTSIHAFFEGDDDPVYFLPLLRRRLPKLVHSYRCNGKPKVRSLRDDVYRIATSKGRILFFVDRDYDDLLGTQLNIDYNTYVTDFYSIESDIATKEAFEITLVDFVGLSRADRQFVDVVRRYEAARQSFEMAMAPVSSWIIAAKALALRPNLSNVDIAKVIKIAHLGDCSKKERGFEELRKACGLAGVTIPQKEICKWRKRIKALDARYWLRGKFSLWFFRTATLQIAKDLISDSSVKRKLKVPKPLQNNLIFEALSPRLSVPVSLEAFISQFEEKSS